MLQQVLTEWASTSLGRVHSLTIYLINSLINWAFCQPTVTLDHSQKELHKALYFRKLSEFSILLLKQILQPLSSKTPKQANEKIYERRLRPFSKKL